MGLLFETQCIFNASKIFFYRLRHKTWPLTSVAVADVDYRLCSSRVAGVRLQTQMSLHPITVVLITIPDHYTVDHKNEPLFTVTLANVDQFL